MSGTDPCCPRDSVAQERGRRLPYIERMEFERSLRLMAWCSALPLAIGCTSLIGDFSAVQGSGADGGEGGTGGAGGTADDGGNAGSAGNGGSAGTTGTAGTAGTSSGGGPDGSGASCALSTSYQRTVTPTPMSLSAYGVVHASQTNVLVFVRESGSGGPPTPDVTFFFRSDRPSDAAPGFPLGGPPDAGAGPPQSIVAVARTANNDGTLILASDNGGPWLYDWADTSDSLPTATPGNAYGAGLGGGLMAASSLGLFYALVFNSGSTISNGTYLDFETGITPPSLAPQGMLNTSNDTGLGDSASARAYVLSDGTVSFIYDAPSGMGLMQAHVATPDGNMTTPAAAPRSLTTVGTEPITASRNGTSNVDLAFAQGTTDDGGTSTYTLYGGTLPESKLFTFDVQKDLKQIDAFGALGANVGMGAPPCWASVPGKLVMLIPAGSAGLNLIEIDLASGTVPFALTGAKNILNSDSSVDRCALGFAGSAGDQYDFDLLWSDNTGSGDVLHYAPLSCTLP